MKSSRNKLEEHLGNEQQLATGLLCNLHVCVVKPAQMPLQTNKLRLKCAVVLGLDKRRVDEAEQEQTAYKH